ncbi:alpha/beta hydrolase [Xanthobacter autotrophicus]|uniref:alpha/beta fold hydrolase n=1 Tax=Xanthobacter TaxID=279 RepID=UPI0024AAA958|nr:alpha/beta hydrolase [Xanthobacter autotrophicus]MDI4663047.1 alpha/beta hydrolase [Xanthobacter autotrophicus]
MKIFVAAMALAAGWACAAEAADVRHRYTVQRGDVTVDVIDEGRGPLMVLLPSSARDSEDYDAVAEGLAKAGFRVLRPQPRGAGASSGPTEGITLHDLANDVALAIENARDGRAIVAGHAFGNWVARMTAVDHPNLVRGVVIVAAAAKNYPKELLVSLRDAGNVTLPDAQRIAALKVAFFAPGNDASIWLKGWHPKMAAYQRPIIAAPKENEWWSGGTAPLLDLQALQDPFRPRSTANDIKAEFGDRVTIATVDNASHALIPEQPDAVVAAIAAWAKALKP